MSCDFKCGDQLLNAKYYDPVSNVYKKVAKVDLDYSTYDNSLASEEIDYAKTKIKELFHNGHIHTLRDILKYVKKSYPLEKREMFDDYYVYQAIDALIPISGNDFNNFRDTFPDKFNRPGYLIYRNRYYIFQPFDENEELPMYYRRNFTASLANKLSVRDYIHNTADYDKYKELQKDDIEGDDGITMLAIATYDFESVQEYYDSRDEFDVVGIIDQESSRKKIRRLEEIKDEFKIRNKRPKILAKKRETGIPSFKGAVCRTSKNKKSLIKLAKKINLDTVGMTGRSDICNIVKDKLFDMEKYSTSSDGNKMTYLIIPYNHPIYPFPLNIEDRIKFVLNNNTTRNPNIYQTNIKTH